MPRPPGHKKSGTPYWVRFSLVMLGFGGFTSAFVLVVLPKRFILQSGLVESGITFESENLPFLAPERGLDVRPTHPRTTESGAAGIGPSEQLWAEVLPLLTAEEYDAALQVFSSYLAGFPNDTDALREYAVTLIRAGQATEAEAVYERLIAAGRLEYRDDLARLLRDRGDMNGALALFRELVADDPDNGERRLELARTLLWDEQYEKAIAQYRLVRNLVRDFPQLRLELAQALYWNGQADEAFALLLGYPSHDSAWPQVKQLLAEILPQVVPQAPGFGELIGRAIQNGDLHQARALYRRLLLRTPLDSDVWVDWVDFLQYELEDLEAARAALISREERYDLSPDQRYRLAQLHVWTGHEAMAEAELENLLRLDPTRAEAWALLGDVRRWEGDLLGARSAYQKALAKAADNELALRGMRDIREQVELAIAARDPSGIGPHLAYFQDSDEFNRLDIAVRGAMRWHTTGLVLETGYRYLDGPASGGAAMVEERGPYAELELVRWWRLGTVRTSVRAGVQQIEPFGNEPVVNAAIEVPDAGGTSLQIGYAHGPAYPHTVTIASVLGGVLSDDFRFSAYRAVGKDWSVAGAATVVSLRGGSTDNWRLGGTVTANRQLNALLAAGFTSRVLTHSRAAPSYGSRRSYWDPSFFWANSLILELRSVAADPWLLFARLTPGFALAREREVVRTQLVPQFGSVAGAEYEKDRFSLEADVAYYRGRAGEYNSLAANLSLSIRP